MSELNEVLLSIIMILGSLVLIVLVFVLVKVSKSLRSMEEQVTNLSTDIRPLVQRLTSITEEGQSLLADINEQKDILENSVLKVRDITESTYRLYNSLYSEVAPTVDTLTGFLASVRRGVQTFVSTWKSGR